MHARYFFAALQVGEQNAISRWFDNTVSLIDILPNNFPV